MRGETPRRRRDSTSAKETSLHQLADFLHALIVHFGYAGLFVVMALGNMGLPAGTEVVVPTAGGLAEHGQFGPSVIPAWIIVGAVATVAEVCGGSILYTVGYYGGLPFVKRYGRFVMFREHELDRVHAFYERYGKLTVFWCRFIPFVRGVAAFPAGLSRMQKRYFLTYTALGSALFCFGLAYLGAVAGRNMDAILGYVHDFGLLVLLVLIVLAAIGVVWWRNTKNREARPEIRPIR